MKVITDALINTEFEKIQNELTALHTKKQELIQMVNNSYPGESEIKICSLNEDGTWNRLSITDNSEAIKAGFWQSVKVERYSTKFENLKNRPKELSA